MKRFVIQVGLFSVVVFALIVLLKSQLPFYWGNTNIERKMNSLQEYEEDFDVLFFGSSRTYRHINPNLFDGMTGKNSYNFGAAGMFYLETHYMMDHIVGRDKTIDTLDVIVPNSKPQDIALANLHSTRIKYFLDFKRLKIALTYFSRRGNWKQVYYHCVSYVENLLAIGEFRDIANFYQRHALQNKEIVTQQKGYYTLEQQLRLEKNRVIQRRRTDYLKSLKGRPNKQAAKISPVSMSTFKIPRLSENNDKHRFLTVSNASMGSDYHFDSGHLNDEGSLIYTEMIAEAYLKETEVQTDKSIPKMSRSEWLKKKRQEEESLDKETEKPVETKKKRKQAKAKEVLK